MPRLATRKRHLQLETLEDRLTPAASQQWLNPQGLTLSFAADGTPVGNVGSNLFSSLGKQVKAEVAQVEILRAFQTFAVNSNINIGLQSERDKIALGGAGLIQGDRRFGDIRVAGSTVETSNVATASPFGWSFGTSAGDVIFNTKQNIGINPTNTAGKYDLFSVALHEAGHVFGLEDDSTDPTSIMYTNYQRALTGLSETDITNLHALYGTPASDAFQINGGNGSFALAAALTYGPNTVATGKLTSLDQLEYFSVTVPAGKKLYVTLQTAGYSLLVPSLNVFDANGNLLKSDMPHKPWISDSSVNFGGQSTAKTYYIQVASSETSVFGMGGFQLVVSESEPVDLKQPPVNRDKLANSTLPTATVLTNPGPGVSGYSYYATMDDTPASHFYRFASPSSVTNQTQAMLISAMSLKKDSSDPGLHVYDQNGSPQAFQVLTNDGLNYTIQVTGVAPNSIYYVQATQQSPGAVQNPSDFHLLVSFSSQGATLVSALAGSTLSQASPTDSGTLTLADASLIHFALLADTGASSVPTNVTMTITDSKGKVILTLTSHAGRPPVTVNYYLGAGAYTLTYKVSLASGAPSGSIIPDTLFELDAGVFSDPQGPAFTASAPLSGTSTTTTSPSDPSSPPPQLTYSQPKPTSLVPYYY